MTVEDTLELIRARVHDLASVCTEIRGQVFLIEQHLRTLNGHVADHESRVRDLESLSPRHLIADNDEDHRALRGDIDALWRAHRSSSGTIAGWKAVLAAAGVAVGLASPWLMILVRGG